MLFLFLFAHLAESETQKKILDIANPKVVEGIKMTEKEVLSGKSVQDDITNNKDVATETTEELVSAFKLLNTETINYPNVKKKEKSDDDMVLDEKEEKQGGRLGDTVFIYEHGRFDMSCDTNLSTVKKNFCLKDCKKEEDQIKKGGFDIREKDIMSDDIFNVNVEKDKIYREDRKTFELERRKHEYKERLDKKWRIANMECNIFKLKSKIHRLEAKTVELEPMVYNYKGRSYTIGGLIWLLETEIHEWETIIYDLKGIYYSFAESFPKETLERVENEIQKMEEEYTRFKILIISAYGGSL